MLISIKKIISSIVFAVILVLPNVAMAHDLLRDSTNTAGAIYHTDPEDDPVIGKTTAIYYDVESKVDLKSSTASMIISNDTIGIKKEVTAIIDGHTVSASYDFPVRGLYTLTLRIVSSDAAHKETVFTSSQKVTQSLKETTPSKQVPVWVKVGLISSVCIFALLLVIAYKRKRVITEQSK